MEQKPGCLSGLVKLLLLDWLFDWLQNRFGWGRRMSCFSCGCGLILFLIFLGLAFSIITGTNWTRIF